MEQTPSSVMIRFYILIALLFQAGLLTAQQHFPGNGASEKFDVPYLLTGATIHPSAGLPAFQGDLLILDGRIAALGEGLDRNGAQVIDLTGYHIYPSFIDLYAQYGIGDIKDQVHTQGEQFVSDIPGAHGWNEALRTDYRAHTGFTIDTESAGRYKRSGFGAVLSHRMDGISRGSGVLVALSEEYPHRAILKPVAAHHLSFKKGSSSQDYPQSLMGAIALIRQTYYDAAWYRSSAAEVNLTLQAWNELDELPVVFEAPGPLQVLRADRIGDEFGKRFIIKGNGMEYQRLAAVKQTGAPLIVPLAFPDAYDVEDPWITDYVTLEQLKHWEMAPFNPAMLAREGVGFCLTAADLNQVGDFLPNLRRAVASGLPEADALRALTETPARLLGVYGEMGSLEAGKWANLLVADKPVFQSDAILYQNWVQGALYEVEKLPGRSLAGSYRLTIGAETYGSEWEAESGVIRVALNDTAETKGSYRWNEGTVTLRIAFPEGMRHSGHLTLTGWATGNGFSGTGSAPGGKPVTWSAELTDSAEAALEEQETLADVPEIPDGMTFPFGAFGRPAMPAPEAVIFRNATVWTNGKQGIIDGTDVYVKDGKIVRVGRDLRGQDARVIDATGLHLTSGIIDEHSHIAIAGGVNEGTQASSAEVRIGDVINSEDVNIYRQLAGGVTASQLLHGSANPIGGQSAMIKLRWGALPDEMKVADAPGFIKFALGENVTRANWGHSGTKRFPQSRMGVEQVFEDYFTRARAYAGHGEGRRDLDLEAVAEILASERFVTCHSYVQSEIAMLMKVAERHGFRLAIFTHILEGYQVAEKMLAHGVGASTFSDWWAYKFEVIDAIPYNAALLNSIGVVTAINSDDAEMGRRLNQEAAKAVKYGGVSEEDAWKMVTLNPAKLLGLDHRMGSVEPGKDADLVLWTDNPLSVYARVLQTWVDGRRYYDAEEHDSLLAAVEAERARLIQAMLEAKHGGATVVKPQPEEEHHYHCDDMEDWCGSAYE